MQKILQGNLSAVAQMLAKLADLGPALQRLGHAMRDCWAAGGKVLTAGNGGSAADAMHLAEELTVRFQKNRRALAALPLTDAAAITCCANDFGFEGVFARQVEALGRPGDVFVGFTTSGNSPSILRALEQARAQKLLTATFLGKDGGKARGMADIEILVPCGVTHHVQEAHLILYHTLCEWVDAHC